MKQSRGRCHSFCEVQGLEQKRYTPDVASRGTLNSEGASPKSYCEEFKELKNSKLCLKDCHMGGQTLWI